jgi:hypothetical protein
VGAKTLEKETTNAFFSHKFETLEIDGRECNFYRVSLKALFDLKNVAKPLVRALTSLFQGVGQENGGRSIKKDHSLADGTKGQETIEEVDGIDPTLAKVKIEEREKAIGDLIDAFLDETNVKVIARLIMDSMRDDFARPITPQAVAEFVQTVDPGTLVAMVKGLVQANVGVLGPLAPRLQEALGKFQNAAGAASETLPES